MFNNQFVIAKQNIISKSKKIKKTILKLALVFCLCLLAFCSGYTPEIDSNVTEEEIQQDINQQIENQLGNIDFGELEEIIKNLSDEQKQIFGSGSFIEKVKLIISGDFKGLGENAVDAISTLIFDDIIKILPIMASILAIGIIAGMLGQISSGNSSSKSLGDIIHFACFGLILVIITGLVLNLLTSTANVLTSVKNQIDAIFPILLTLLTAIGGNVSVSVYQPAIALLSGSVMHIFNSLLVPIFIFTFVFSIISNLSKSVKLNKFTSFFSSLFKYIIGTIFTVFLAFISIQGITAGSIDGISVKTAKFAMKSYIPILGGYLADGFNVIVASSVLIKNAVGACGLLAIFVTILSPIISIILLSLLLKLTASVLEPLSDGRISSFLFSVSKSLTMLMVILIGFSFMFLLLCALIMCSANFV